MLIKKISPTPETKKNSQRSFRERASLKNEQYHEVSGMGNLRKNLSLSGISETGFHSIVVAKRETPISNHKLP